LNTPFRPRPRPGGNRFRPPQTPDAHRINHRILAREVRLISDDGEQLGIVPIKQALEIAEQKELDLVEVAGEAKPPVCRLMDYGKFKYKEQKKEAEARKRRTENTVKELRIRYRTDIGDLETKLKHAREFLDEGDKVKFSMRFKGREIMYLELGVAKLNQIVERLSDVATVDEKGPLSGKQIYIVLAPSKKTGP
jgi:translation initiation factor IF-3